MYHSISGAPGQGPELSNQLAEIQQRVLNRKDSHLLGPAMFAVLKEIVESPFGRFFAEVTRWSHVSMSSVTWDQQCPHFITFSVLYSREMVKMD